MTRAELIQWAEHPRHRTGEVAAAVRALFHDFKMLAAADGVPGYEALRIDLATAAAALTSFERDNHRLREELAALQPAPWET